MKKNKFIGLLTCVFVIISFIPSIHFPSTNDPFLWNYSPPQKNSIFPSFDPLWTNATVISDDFTGWNDGDSDSPAMIIDNNRNLHVVWHDTTDGKWGTDLEIMYTNYTETGWSNATVISDIYGWNNDFSISPDIAIDINGNLHVVWHDFTNTEWGSDVEIMYVNYTAAGWSNATVISDDSTGWNTGASYDSSIATDNNGNIHVVWEDDTDGEWGSDLEIMYVNYTAASGWSNATVISDDYTGWNVDTSYDPDIAIDSNDNLHVVWYDNTNGKWGIDTEIMYVNYTAASGWTNATIISDIYGWNTGASGGPTITTDKNENLHVVWFDATNGEWGTDYEIMYANYTAASGWSNATVISDDTGWNLDHSYNPCLAVDNGLNIHVAWHDETNGEWGIDREIMYTNYTGAGWSNATVISDDITGWNIGSSSLPSIAVDIFGGIHLVWDDETNGSWGTDTEIMYAQKSGQNLPPFSNHPEDIITFNWGSETIDWILYDDLGEGEYAVFVNDTHNNYYTWINWTPWINNTPILVPINRTVPGMFNYRIEFNDSSSNYATDSVMVTVSNMKIGSWKANGTPVSTAVSPQYNVELCTDNEGGAIIAWSDERSGDNDIYAHRINANGALLWTPNGTPICTAPNNQYEPKIISDGVGGAIITWIDRRNSTLTEVDIYAQHVDSNGIAQWAADGVPICTWDRNQDNVRLTSDGLGGAIITWEDERGGIIPDIYAQRINASGNIQWTPNGTVICNQTDQQYDPNIISDGNGGAIIVWIDYRVNVDIYAQRIDSIGNTLWIDNGSVICNADNYQWDPRICSDGAGGAIIAWEDGRGALGEYDIYAQRINGSGNSYWIGNGTPICTVSEDQDTLGICSDGNGGAFISWRDYRTGIDSDVYAQYVASNGTTMWTLNGHAVSNEIGNQASTNDPPCLCPNGDGGVYIVWRDYRGGIDWDIYIQELNANGQFLLQTNGTPLITGNGHQNSIRLSCNKNGTAIITWYDSRLVDSDVYAQGIKKYIYEIPTSNHPADFSTSVIDTATIGWRLYDSYYPGYYSVIANDTNGFPYQWVDWTPWKNNTSLSVPINRTALGTFRYTINYNDSEGNFGIADTVFVTITEAVTPWEIGGIPICTEVSTQRTAQQPTQIISDGANGAIITWEDYRDSNYDIYAQRINRPGIPLWETNGTPISNFSNNQQSPDLCSDGSGGAILTWIDFRSGTTYDIYAQRINSTGQRQWTENGIVISNATNDQLNPKSCSDEQGGAIIAWEDYRNSHYDIFLQRIDANGNVKWDLNGTPICNATSNQQYIDIYSDGEAIFLTWQDQRGLTRDIYVQKIDMDGNSLWDVNGTAVCTEIDDQWYPKLVSDGSGGVIIAWEDERIGGISDVYAQRVYSNGTIAWLANGTPICTESDDQGDIELCGDGLGNAIITWYDNRGTGSDIYAQRITKDGSITWRQNGTPICDEPGNQYDPVICCDENGGAVIAWEDYRNGLGNRDVYIQHINSDGTINWLKNGITLCNASGHQYSIQMTHNEDGAVIAAWTDERNGSSNRNIYAQSTYNNRRPTSNHPDDIITLRTGSETIDWLLYDDLSPGKYRILKDGSPESVWLPWSNNTPIIVSINRSAINLYNYTIEYNDSHGEFGIPDTVIVNVTNSKPTNNNPYDLTTPLIGTQNITWVLYDEWDSGQYRVWANDTNGNSYIWINWNSWTNNSNLAIPINRTVSGVFNYTIEYNDSHNLFGDPDTVIVYLIEGLHLPWDHDGVAICTATSQQTEQQICSDGNGGAIITWHDTRGGMADVYAQKVSSTGTVQWMGDGVSVSTAADHQYYPQLCGDGAGGAIITWQDGRDVLTNDYDVYAQRIDSNGNANWTVNGVGISVLGPVGSAQGAPQICSDGSGGAIITWVDRRSGVDIYAQRVDSAGSTQWTANGISICTASNTQEDPQICSDGAGGAIITWTDWRSGTNADIYAQRVNSAGTTQWTANGIAICAASNNQEYPQICGNGTGGATITWQDERSGSNYDVYAQKINSAGVIQWTSNGVVISNASNSQTAPQICCGGDEGALITWQDERSGSNYDVYAQKINSSGITEWTSNGTAVNTEDNHQYFPQICCDGDGGAIIAWEDMRNGTYSDIYAQNIGSDGKFVSNGIPISMANRDQEFPQICSDDDGGAIITWLDTRNSATSSIDIYAQYINTIPTSTHPNDIITYGNGTETINWTLYDSPGGGKYRVWVNDTNNKYYIWDWGLWTPSFSLNIAINRTFTGIFNYTIEYNDSNDLFGNPDTVIVTIMDAYPPIISTLLQDPIAPSCLDYVNITVRVIDFFNISHVLIEHNLTNPLFENYTMSFLSGDIETDGWWNYTIAPGLAGTTVSYRIICNDTVGWWDNTIYYNYIPIDVVNPVIQLPVLQDPASPTCLDSVNISVNVQDNVNISHVVIEHNLTTFQNYTMHFLSGERDTNSWWNYTIYPGAAGTTISYRIICNDTAGLWNSTTFYYYTPTDAIAPVIQLPILQDPPSPTCLESVNVTVHVLDNFNISHVIIEHNLTNPLFENSTMSFLSGDRETDGWWEYILGQSPAGTTVSYRIVCNDTAGLWNSTTFYYYTPTDAIAPVIQLPILQDPPSPTCLEAVNITVNITDNFNISHVVIEHNLTEPFFKNYTMEFLSGNREINGWWNYTIAPGPANTTISFRIICNDTAGLWDSTTYYYYTPTDVIAPVIQLPILQDPASPTCLESVNVTVHVLDNFNISHVIIEHNLTNPLFENSTMSFLSGDRETDGWWEYILGQSPAGTTVSYRIICNDTAGLWDSTTYYYYTPTDVLYPVIQLPILQDPASPSCLDSVNITVNVLDNYNISHVIIEHNFTNPLFENYTMDFLNGIRDTNGWWNFTIAPGFAGTTIAYRIICNDTTGFWNYTTYYYYTISGSNGLKQKLNPGVNYIYQYDDIGFLWINITIDVDSETNITLTSDTTAIDQVKSDGIIYFEIILENETTLNMITIWFHYNQSLLAENGISEGDIAIFYYNEGARKWVDLKGKVDMDLNFIEVTLTSLSQFSIAPKEEGIMLFPPPAAEDNLMLYIIIGGIGAAAAVAIGIVVNKRKKPKLAPKKKLTKRKIEEVLIKRAYDYVGGNIRYKVVVENATTQNIKDISVELDVKKQFKVDTTIQKIELLEPGESRGSDFILNPLTCGKSRIHGAVSYHNIKDELISMEVAPSVVQIKCPLVQPKAMELADLIDLMDKLQKSHTEINYAGLSKSIAYEIAKEQISSLDVTKIDENEAICHIIYAGEAKVGGDTIIINLNVDEDKKNLIIDVYLKDIKQATGFLAYIKNLINLAIQYSTKISSTMDAITSKIYNAFEYSQRLLELNNLCLRKAPIDDILLILKELNIKTNKYFPDLKITTIFTSLFNRWINDLEKIKGEEIWERTYTNLQYDSLNMMDALIVLSETNTETYLASPNVDPITKKNIEEGNKQLKEQLRTMSEQYSETILFALMILEKTGGLNLYTHNFKEGEQRLDSDLIGGFLTAIKSFGMELSREETAMKKLSYEHFEIELLEGEYSLVAIITMGIADQLTKDRQKEFLTRFEAQFEDDLKSFVGEVGRFRPARDLVDEIFLKKIA